MKTIRRINHSKKIARGFSLYQVLITGTVLLTICISVATIVLSTLRFASRTQRAVSATYIAEAGINYYLWHLSHNVSDYCDGQTCGTLGPDGYGPFNYDYTGADGRKLGSYSVYVKPPAGANAAVTVKSIGNAVGGTAPRTLQASIAIPSFAQYAILTNTEIWIGPNETVDGALHSNIGVHFDGVGNDVISSAQATYSPTAPFGGNGQTKNGVWGNGTPQSLWRFPVPSIDFQGVSTDLQKLKADAQANGKYLAPTNSAQPSSKLGYYLELRADGGIDVYKLTREQCTSTNRTFVQTLSKPANNILFVDDNVWIRNKPGELISQRLTIAAAYLPSNSNTDKTITIMGDIKYSAKDGSVALGLVAQKDVKVSRQAPSTLEINAAMLAQSGHVWYQKDTLGGSTCSQLVKNAITVYGTIATNSYWTWTYVSGNNTVDGYNTTTSTYDKNLRLTPPPSFPLTGNFSILNYREILLNP